MKIAKPTTVERQPRISLDEAELLRLAGTSANDGTVMLGPKPRIGDFIQGRGNREPEDP